MTDTLTPKQIAALIGLGLFAGLFSGLFGVGGGMIIVPGLVVALRVEHKLAVGTSLMAIIPACTVGIISYAFAGSVDWYAGLTVAIGAIAGAQIGSHLLGLLPRRAAQWVFIAFVMAMIAQLLIIVPQRTGTMTWSVGHVIALIGLGLIAGIAAGLLGIGGGVIVVPIMMLLFGVSDLIAKGVSLVMMLPGVLSALIGNLRGHRVLVRAGLVIGFSAVLTGPLGSRIAHILPERPANILFACYLVFVCIMMIRKALTPDKQTPDESTPGEPAGESTPDTSPST